MIYNFKNGKLEGKGSEFNYQNLRTYRGDYKTEWNMVFLNTLTTMKKELKISLILTILSEQEKWNMGYFRKWKKN